MINIKIGVLASGSNGNSIMVKAGKTRLLFDAGLSGKGLANRMAFLGEDISKVNAIFLSHEHVDHNRGIGVLERRFNFPLYMSEDTFNSSSRIIGKVDNINFINHDKINKINDIEVKSFNVSHDAVDTCGFLVKYKDKRIGIMTDLGYGCENVMKVIPKVDALVLESNHDKNMLKTGRYPFHLKQRINSDNGHLSNDDCASLVKDYGSSKLKHVFLAHLSHDNNTPSLAYQTFVDIVKQSEKFKNLNVDVTSRFRALPFIDV